ncbi:glycosyltransferase family 2 protein [Nocardiopsis suaedae]|uniref:Hyaluronan synthase n=1 Tax=Nocardiopsis suaedae TaxID=3018444 RepID=A0ABT4TJQ5_9ACTN|nr:glycosyltransferase family 2 protein [Nocardiopsis suaedae]MDA2804911.1 glycosyltransferase family 2 protein [Nocardiopsis suaedae]
MCGSIALLLFGVWAVLHLFYAVAAHRSGSEGLAMVWAVCFLLLWWVPLAWFDRPTRAPADKRAELDGLAVTVQIPVYNEDPGILRQCLRSVLEQTRPVQRVRVVDDGSVDPGTGEPMTYARIRDDFLARATALGVEATWDRTVNRGKRFAQMHVLGTDPADIFITLDSDSIMDRNAVREGLQPFADPKVQSVAGHVIVLNSRATLLTRLTCLLYLPFTRGLRSAQSVLGRVTINSGTLAFYRAETVRSVAGVYEHEQFWGRPMQMNDDSMLTFYALLRGNTVHQPSALVFTLVPERLRHYLGQQLRWMRGTTVRHLWWLRYMPVTGVVFWGTVAEYLHLLLGVAIPAVVFADPVLRAHWQEIGFAALLIGSVLNYVMALRIFAVRRSDESPAYRVLLFLLSPVAGAWRIIMLRPLYLYAMLTCRRIAQWGTRESIDVALGEDGTGAKGRGTSGGIRPWAPMRRDRRSAEAEKDVTPA